MKKLLFILLVFSFSCRATENTEKKSEIENDSISEIIKNDSIVREWSIGSTISVETVRQKNGTTIRTETETLCNSCPTIIFNADGTGALTNQAGKSLFNWAIERGRLRFTFIKKNKHLFFGKVREFDFKIHHDSRFYYLELIVAKDNYRYILIASRD